MEIGPIDGIVDRLSNLDEESDYLQRLRSGYNHLFLPETERRRKELGRWTVGNIPKGSRKRGTNDNDNDNEKQTQISIDLQE